MGEERERKGSPFFCTLFGRREVVHGIEGQKWNMGVGCFIFVAFDFYFKYVSLVI